jgi:hypothetical protein
MATKAPKPAAPAVETKPARRETRRITRRGGERQFSPAERPNSVDTLDEIVDVGVGRHAEILVSPGLVLTVVPVDGLDEPTGRPARRDGPCALRRNWPHPDHRY